MEERIRLKDMTLEQLVEKETNIIATTKERARLNIIKLKARRYIKLFPLHVARIKSLITLHENREKELNKKDPLLIAKAKIKNL